MNEALLASKIQPYCMRWTDVCVSVRCIGTSFRSSHDLLASFSEHRSFCSISTQIISIITFHLTLLNQATCPPSRTAPHHGICVWRCATHEHIFHLQLFKQVTCPPSRTVTHDGTCVPRLMRTNALWYLQATHATLFGHCDRTTRWDAELAELEMWCTAS